MTGVIERLVRSDEALAMPPGLMVPLPHPEWSLRMRSLDVDGVRADYVEVGPHRLEVPPFAERPDEPVRMMLVVILEGSTTGEVDGRALTLTSKQAAIVDGRAAMRFHAARPLRALRLFVDEDHLPAGSLQSRSLPFAILKHTPLVTGCIGLITGLLQVGSAEIERHDEVAVGHPLVALLTSLLDEALHAGPPAVPHPYGEEQRTPEARRARVAAHIDEHLADRDLSVDSIAAALGVTARTLHGAFQDGETTVAGEIRARRLARAQALLVVRREAPNVAALAERVGLGRDQLTRLFKASTGRTATQWWQDHHA